MDDTQMAKVAHAIMLERVKFGWTFGKRPKVMGIDLVMARAAIEAMSDVDPAALRARSAATA